MARDEHIFFSLWVTGELSTLRQLMKVPNEPGLSPNNGLENVSLSDRSMASNPRKGQAKCPGAMHPVRTRRCQNLTLGAPCQAANVHISGGRASK